MVKLLADDALGSKREDASIPLLDSYTQAFDQIEQDKNQNLCVLDLNGEVVGLFQLTFIPYLTYKGSWRAQLEGVRVHSEHRGKQWGDHIMDWCISKSKEKGAHVLQLTTDKQRPKALSFYLRHGMVASHEGLKLHL
ncbi:MAG: GNAT family N-acetyltransferase [Schleiferiaceae bacterium]